MGASRSSGLPISTGLPRINPSAIAHGTAIFWLLSSRVSPFLRKFPGPQPPPRHSGPKKTEARRPGPCVDRSSTSEPNGATQSLTLTAAGSVLGTLAYMAPEQALGRDADPRSDIFSLGVVLYEMATGQRPFRRKTPAGILGSILTESPKKPSSHGFAKPTCLRGGTKSLRTIEASKLTLTGSGPDQRLIGPPSPIVYRSRPRSVSRKRSPQYGGLARRVGQRQFIGESLTLTLNDSAIF
jgi:serine/threonine protein kinase